MCAAELNDDQDRDSPSELFGRAGALAAQIEASLTLAKEVLAGAARHVAACRLHLERCVGDLEHAQTEVHSLQQELARGNTPRGGEQVSSAGNAPGDGADDAQVVPDESRGKPGNWPAY